MTKNNALTTGNSSNNSANSHSAEGTPTRGVQNPKVIDLITKSQSRANTVELHILEERPWYLEDSLQALEQVQELETKLNTYFDYILDGFFGAQYTQYLGMDVVICLISPEAPSPLIDKFLEAASRFAQQAKLQVCWRSLEDAPSTPDTPR